MATILDEIVAYKRGFVAAQMQRVSLESLARKAEEAPAGPSFFERLVDHDDIAVIAEVKKASPSKGVIRSDFDPVEIARAYSDNGASALSVLTDEKFFQGSASFLPQIREAVGLPILRKDFFVNPYQIYEARCLGASAVLLIASILHPGELAGHLCLCRELDLDALVEVHSEEDVVKAVDAGAEMVGINNRDLRTFETTLEITFRLIDCLPDEVVKVSESGIHTREDVVRLRDAGADAVLVGEGLVRQPDIGRKLRELTGKEPA